MSESTARGLFFGHEPAGLGGEMAQTGFEKPYRAMQWPPFGSGTQLWPLRCTAFANARK